MVEPGAWRVVWAQRTAWELCWGPAGAPLMLLLDLLTRRASANPVQPFAAVLPDLRARRHRTQLTSAATLWAPPPAGPRAAEGRYNEYLGMAARDLLSEGVARLVEDANHLEPFFLNLAGGQE